MTKINGTKKQNGRPEKWSEPCTGSFTLPKGTTLYHASDKRINSFQSCETCFYVDDNSTRGFQYKVTLLKDVEVEEFGSEEVRFVITAKNVEINYRGTREIVIDFESPLVWTGIGNRAGWERPKTMIEKFI